MNFENGWSSKGMAPFTSGIRYPGAKKNFAHNFVTQPKKTHLLDCNLLPPPLIPI